MIFNYTIISWANASIEINSSINSQNFQILLHASLFQVSGNFHTACHAAFFIKSRNPLQILCEIWLYSRVVLRAQIVLIYSQMVFLQKRLVIIFVLREDSVKSNKNASILAPNLLSISNSIFLIVTIDYPKNFSDFPAKPLCSATCLIWLRWLDYFISNLKCGGIMPYRAPPMIINIFWLVHFSWPSTSRIFSVFFLNRLQKRIHVIFRMMITPLDNCLWSLRIAIIRISSKDRIDLLVNP